MRVYLLLSLVTLALSGPLALEKEWQQWKQQHGKQYADEVEESMRRAVWFRAYHLTQSHNNADMHSYTLGLNMFSDMVSVLINSTYKLRLCLRRQVKNSKHCTSHRELKLCYFRMVISQN